MLGCLLFAQEKELAVQEQLRVEYVLVDLLVLDRQNRPIKDLSKEDFIVRDGKKKIAIESFEILDYQSLEAASHEVVSAMDAQEKEVIAVPRQQFIFAVDQESLYLGEIRKSFTQLRRTIDESKLPENADYLLYSMESGVITDGFISGLGTFLTELALFEDRLIERYRDEAEYAGSGGNRVQGRSSGGNRRLQELDKQLRGCSDGPEGVIVTQNPGSNLSCISNAVELFIEDEELRLNRVMGELTALAYRFEAEAGLKSIFFISPGFSLNPGVEAVALAKSYLNFSAFGKRGSHQGEVRDALEAIGLPKPKFYQKDFQKVVHACTRNRVVFHSVDIFTTAQELGVEAFAQEMKLNNQDIRKRIYVDYLRQQSAGLERLATMSGGFYSRAPSLKKIVTKWIPRTRYVYLLGYTSPQGKPGAYRKIKVKCKRKGAKLHYRRGYYAAD